MIKRLDVSVRCLQEVFTHRRMDSHGTVALNSDPGSNSVAGLCWLCEFQQVSSHSQVSDSSSVKGDYTRGWESGSIQRMFTLLSVVV